MPFILRSGRLAEGVERRHPSVWLCQRWLVPPQRQQAPSGLSVADLVDAGPDEGVEGLSSVSLAAPHGVAGAVATDTAAVEAHGPCSSRHRAPTSSS